jgi:hypothetical protein
MRGIERTANGKLDSHEGERILQDHTLIIAEADACLSYYVQENYDYLPARGCLVGRTEILGT